MSNIELFFDWNGERIRISGAKLRTQTDADELVGAITILRRLLPFSAATEKADGTPPAGGDDAPTSPAPILSAARAASPAKPTGPQVKLAAEGALSSASGGMQDGLPVHPATHSEAPAVEGSARSGKSAKAKAFVATANEQKETTLKRKEVAALHAAEPWLTPDEAAARVSLPVVNLRIFTSELEIEWGGARPGRSSGPVIAAAPSTTLLQKVTAMHRMHPTWTAALIARELGAARNSVSAYLSIARRTVAEEQASAA